MPYEAVAVYGEVMLLSELHVFVGQFPLEHTLLRLEFRAFEAVFGLDGIEMPEYYRIRLGVDTADLAFVDRRADQEFALKGVFQCLWFACTRRRHYGKRQHNQGFSHRFHVILMQR